MPTVRVKENEPFEVALRRFKRTVEKTGLLTELRAREYYEKPTQARKRKLAAAIKRHFKRLRSQQLPPKLYWSPGVPVDPRAPDAEIACRRCSLLAPRHDPEDPHHRRHEGRHEGEGGAAPRHGAPRARGDQAARGRRAEGALRR